jgi:large subunit ribosomal protein L32
MAVPKRKTSHARKMSRKATWLRTEAPSLMECPQCHEPKLPHRVCGECGYYNRKQIIEVE